MSHFRISYRYNIHPDDLPALLAGDCKICGMDRRLEIDHDHSCCDGPYSCGKCIRGAICKQCNNSLREMEIRIELVRARLSYIENAHEEVRPAQWSKVNQKKHWNKSQMPVTL